MPDDTAELDEAEQLISQLLEASFSQGGEETGDEEPDEEEVADDTGDEEEPAGDEEAEPGESEAPPGDGPAPAAQAVGPFDSLTEQEKAALLKVRSLLTDNPDLAEGFDKLVKAKFEPEPDRTLPPEIDPEDETSVRLWNEIQAVMANFPNDPAEGVARALEIGSMTDPLTRDKVLGVDAKTVEAQATAKRQKKLTALSGSTGSGPRTKPQTKKPESWNEVAGRLAKELEALGGV